MAKRKKEEFEIWAEKYRPKTFSEIINQEHVINRVKAFVKEKNIPHLLFAGPAGTGKTTTALVIARSLYGEAWRQNILELNASVTENTPILVRINGKTWRTTFKQLADIFFEGKEDVCFVNGMETLSVDKDFNVKFLPVEAISRHKRKYVYEIFYESGKVEVTPDHSLIVIGKDGNLVSKKAKEIKEGDYVISFVSTIEGHKKYMDLSKFMPELYLHLRSNVIRNPKVKVLLEKIELNEKNSEILGLYAAERFISFRNHRSGQTIFTFGYPNEVNLVKKVENFAKTLGISVSRDLTSSAFDRSRFSAIQARLLSTQLAKFFLSSFYLDGRKVANNKIVPYFIFDSEINSRISFIKSYFEGDGYGKWGKYVRISSTSKDLLIDVAWLGRMSGLKTSVFSKGVRIRWYEKGSYKHRELLPASIFISFFERIKDKVKGNWRYLLRHQLYWKKSSRVKKSTLAKVLRLVEEEKLNEEERKVFERLKMLVNSNLCVLKVKKIRKKKYNGWVYDFSVPSSQSFFGGAVPILLHNSDARGIDVIRGRVKDFARTKAIGEVPFKLIILDEADALTNEAQQALRRTMEDFSDITRFILICNYSSKIIDPIQSRCVVFRFRSMDEKHVKKFVERIVKNEKLKIDKDGIQAIIEIAEGDLRRTSNLLQAASAISDKITEDVIYEVASLAKPTDIRELIDLSLKRDFSKAREKLIDLLVKQGLAGEDIIRQIHKEVLRLDIPEEKKIELIEKIGEYEFRLSEGGDPFIQLSALLAFFSLVGER